MIDKIKSIINSELTMLPYKFFDLEDALQTRSELESRFSIDAHSLFDSQRKLDMLKRSGRRNFNALCAIYFSSFIKPHGFDLDLLDTELRKNKSVMERHLGKDWVFALNLIVKINKELNPKISAPQGLLKRVI